MTIVKSILISLAAAVLSGCSSGYSAYAPLREAPANWNTTDGQPTRDKAVRLAHKPARVNETEGPIEARRQMFVFVNEAVIGIPGLYNLFLSQ